MTFEAPPDPITSVPSMICTSNGADTASHPASGALTFGNENTTAVAAPASTVTVRSAEPVSLVTVTLCWAAVNSSSATGERPTGRPSMLTCAPGGSVTTDMRPTTTTGSVTFISKY